MAKKTSTLSELIVEPFREWGKDNASALAAALAYYAVMSLVPLLLIVVIIASYFFKTNTAMDQLTSQIARFTSPEIASFIKSLLVQSNNTSHGSIASIISIITLVFGASGIFSQLQSSLNRIWNVPPQKQAGIKKSIKNHLVSFLMVIAIGFLFLIFLLIDAVVSILISNIPAGSQNRTLAVVVNSVVLFLLLTVSIAFIFRVVPDREITWGDVWLGAAVTALLFLVGRYLIGFYLSFNKTASGYGAAGSLIVLLIWIYYSAQIFFFGAEFTQVYARTVGSHKALEKGETHQNEKEQVVTG
jgi:membrane protein